jgi:hypothetical protein
VSARSHKARGSSNLTQCEPVERTHQSTEEEGKDPPRPVVEKKGNDKKRRVLPSSPCVDDVLGASCRTAIVGVEVVVESLWCVVVADAIPPARRALYWLL